MFMYVLGDIDTIWYVRSPSVPRSASVANIVTTDVPMGLDSSTEKVVPTGTLAAHTGVLSFSGPT